MGSLRMCIVVILCVLWVGQDSIGDWFELRNWFFWVISFELDQEYDYLHYSWVMRDYDFVGFWIGSNLFCERNYA